MRMLDIEERHGATAFSSNRTSGSHGDFEARATHDRMDTWHGRADGCC